MYLIALYEDNRAYGGPEEGGWWYDTGTLVRVVAVARRKDRAYELAKRCDYWLEKCWQKRPMKYRIPVSSVNYTGGHFSAHVYKHVAPQHFPEVRPQYE
jgi:hypothetical protein